MNREELNEYLDFPRKLTQAVVRGIGRMIMEKWQENVYKDNPYIHMTEEQRREIAESDLL